MELGLTGGVALVTGASRGLGRAIALELAGEGMDVALVARSREPLEEVGRAVAARGRAALVCAADLREPSAAAACVTAVHGRFGRLDLLVNNAGATRRGDVLELGEEAWADGFALKFYGALRLARAAWTHLAAARGTIVNIAGVGGRTGSAEFAVGGAVNAALMLLTKALAERGIADGVRVNAVNPGSIATDRLAARISRHAAAHGLTPPEAEQAMLRRHAIARFGRPEEIGALVAMMASRRVEFLAGAIIDIDGGQTRTL